MGSEQQHSTINNYGKAKYCETHCKVEIKFDDKVKLSVFTIEKFTVTKQWLPIFSYNLEACSMFCAASRRNISNPSCGWMKAAVRIIFEVVNAPHFERTIVDVEDSCCDCRGFFSLGSGGSSFHAASTS